MIIFNNLLLIHIVHSVIIIDFHHRIIHFVTDSLIVVHILLRNVDEDEKLVVEVQHLHQHLVHLHRLHHLVQVQHQVHIQDHHLQLQGQLIRLIIVVIVNYQVLLVQIQNNRMMMKLNVQV